MILALVVINCCNIINASSVSQGLKISGGVFFLKAAYILHNCERIIIFKAYGQEQCSALHVCSAESSTEFNATYFHAHGYRIAA